MPFKVAVVILNYMNYENTIECVESVLSQEYSLEGIVIVDNGSFNSSFNVLHERYKKNTKIRLLKAKKNEGYAKGNNIGINYARIILKTDFVLILNNDIVLTKTDFISKMLADYEKGVGVLGSKIVSAKIYGSSTESKYVKVSAMWIQLFYYWCEFFKLRELQYTIGKFLKKCKKEKILYGCALMLTPDFFECYGGFYPNTFLYYEENTLSIMVERVNLKEKYVCETELLHKQNESFIAGGLVGSQKRYLRESYWHVLLVALMPLSLLKRVAKGKDYEK